MMKKIQWQPRKPGNLQQLYISMSFKGDLYIVIIVEKEVSHYWKYGYQQYNAYSLKL
jgi:hypothetical protein